MLRWRPQFRNRKWCLLIVIMPTSFRGIEIQSDQQISFLWASHLFPRLNIYPYMWRVYTRQTTIETYLYTLRPGYMGSLHNMHYCNLQLPLKKTTILSIALSSNCPLQSESTCFLLQGLSTLSIVSRPQVQFLQVTCTASWGLKNWLPVWLVPIMTQPGLYCNIWWWTCLNVHGLGPLSTGYLGPCPGFHHWFSGGLEVKT